MIKVLSCITGQHSIPLVLLAAAVCAFGCFTALSLLARARDAKTGAIDWRWLVASSAVAGAAVWSTHFVSMLAYEPSFRLKYEIGLTALSIAVAMVVTLVGFAIVLYYRAAMLGGAVFGAAIGSMHFTGMKALTAPATFAWDPVYVTASLLIGVGVGALALHAFVKGRGW